MSFVASKIYEPSFEEISESARKKDLEGVILTEEDKRNISFRKNAKSAGFAINYGGNGKTIAENLGIPLEKGDEIYDAYFEAFPGAKNYFKRIQAESFKNGWIIINPLTNRKYYIEYFEDYRELENLTRRDNFWQKRRDAKANEHPSFETYYAPITKRYFDTKHTIEKLALNYPIQGSAAEITKLATYFIFMEIVKRDWLFKVLISNIVHDELLLECPEELASTVSEITTENMARAGKKLGCTRVPLTATAHVVDWWNH